MKNKKDKFGRVWNLPKNEVCPKCGQPDSCGDCNHKRLTNKEVEFIKNGCTNKAIKKITAKKRYYLLRVGDLVEDGDEEYSADELMDKYPEPKWRSVAVNFVGEVVQDEDPPVRRIMD